MTEISDVVQDRREDLRSYEQSERANLTISELLSRAELLETQQRLDGAIRLYRDWIARNPSDSLLHAAYFNYAVALNKSGDRYGAMNALRASLQLRSDFQQAHINLGRLLEDDGQIGPAIQQWLLLIEQTGAVSGDAVRNKLLTLQQLGRVLEGAHQDASAEDALRQSLDINDAQSEIAQHWIALRQRQCKWPVISGIDTSPPEKLAASISPLSLAVMGNDPVFQLARAYKYSRDLTGRPRRPLCPPTARAKSKSKLHIGYVSSDLREHAVGFAMTDVMEAHDRDAFEISAYYCGIDRVDDTQRRIKNRVDQWVDLKSLSDEAAAAKIHADGVDILIDLNGYTKDARSALFSYRPAPVIVNWFGFPGTIGSPFHNYIIADPITVPEQDEIFYSEKVLRLPCYQPNDRKRVVAEQTPSRASVGLPEGAIVYCCFNGVQKITPSLFANWMQILREVPNSVLWILGTISETQERLSQLTVQNGIDAKRLVFAEKQLNPQHLARYVLADLFLDTFPYGAHTTASDALWMGVPVLTFPGRTFASRVCASLVSASGLSELVCADAATYVARAIELGRDKARIGQLKAKLRANRSSCVLFDTPRLVRELEQLYREMWSQAVNGTLPIPDLANLDTYFEIGLQLVAGEAAAEPTDLLDWYREKLAEWNAGRQLAKDARLFSGT